MSFLIINKGAMEVYERHSLSEAAYIAGSTPDSISWSVKRTGRWDREDGVIVVIPSTPEEV